MILFTEIFTPMTILFLAAFGGYLVGKIKIFHVSLDLAGILFTAIVIGFLIKISGLNENALYLSELDAKMQAFSDLGSALFVSVIGIYTGVSLQSNTKQNLFSLMIGICMSLTGYLVAFRISDYFPSVSSSTLLGVLCGALTSTPALSAACERNEICSSEAILGYSGSYLFGVVLAVLAVSLLSPKTVSQSGENQKPQEKGKNAIGSMGVICVVAALGNMVGGIRLLNLYFSLGNTGAILCTGMAIGYWLQKSNRTEKLSMDTLNIFKKIGLALFFVGTGLGAAMEITHWDWKVTLFGMVITGSALLCGLLLIRVVFSHAKLSTGSVLSGGMTSSPALGVLTEANKEPSVSQFSFAYFGALLTLVWIARVFG